MKPFSTVAIDVMIYFSGVTKNPLGSYPDHRDSKIAQPEMNYVLVTGGSDWNYAESQQMEVFDENGQTRICNLKSKYPLRVSGAVGVFTDEKMIVCGGMSRCTGTWDTSMRTPSCYVFEVEQYPGQYWKMLANMNTPRSH